MEEIIIREVPKNKKELDAALKKYNIIGHPELLKFKMYEEWKKNKEKDENNS